MTEIVHATFAALELRVPDMSERIVEGIVVPWAETSFLTPDPKGERFMSGSLTRTIDEKAKKGQSIKLFRNHDHDQAVGKAVAWKSAHELGCWAQFRLYRLPTGDDVLVEVREGMLDAFSVGFLPIRDRRGTDGAREVIEADLQRGSLDADRRLRRGAGARRSHPGQAGQGRAATDAGDQPGSAATVRAVLR